MKISSKEITALYVRKMNEIAEFRAFTQLAYGETTQSIDKGKKFKLYLQPLQRE